MLFQLVPGGFSYLINQNHQNSNWKKLLRFRYMQFSLFLNLSFSLFKQASNCTSPIAWWKNWSKASGLAKIRWTQIAVSDQGDCPGRPQIKIQPDFLSVSMLPGMTNTQKKIQIYLDFMSLLTHIIYYIFQGGNLIIHPFFF